jgi:hypothetical protein
MPRPPKAVHTGVAKGQEPATAGKLRLYEILYNINQSFEEVLAQLKTLERFGIRRRAATKLQVIVEETRAEVNFELVDLLHERELKEWTHFGRMRERPRKARGSVAREGSSSGKAGEARDTSE